MVLLTGIQLRVIFASLAAMPSNFADMDPNEGRDDDEKKMLEINLDLSSNRTLGS